jgi:cyclase
MSFKRIIPCLDMRDGRVVKGVNFVNIIDAGDPVELAQRYEQEGADELVLLDITATEQGRKTLVDVVRKTAAAITIPLGVGGGIASLEDFETIFDAGAAKVAMNSAAVRQPELLQAAAEKFGREKVVACVDPKKVQKSGRDFWEVFISGGKVGTGLDAVAWSKEVERLGAGEIVLTSMDGDGTKKGYDLEITRAVAEAVAIPVIASGGAGSLQDLADGILIGKADGVLAASIFHFGEVTIPQVKAFFRENGIEVRI